MLIMGEHNKFQSSTFCSNVEGVKHSPPLGYFNLHTNKPHQKVGHQQLSLI
jgi:hypothetical protein